MLIELFHSLPMGQLQLLFYPFRLSRFPSQEKSTFSLSPVGICLRQERLYIICSAKDKLSQR